jgi:hypothetical protein
MHLNPKLTAASFATLIKLCPNLSTVNQDDYGPWDPHLGWPNDTPPPGLVQWELRY